MEEPELVVLQVVGVRRHAAVEEIVVLLLDTDSELVVPILIGPTEAGAIASAQAGVVPPRPMTHDLLRDLVLAAGEQVVGVRITRLEDGIFHAEIELGNGARVDARASDAIAVALRFGVAVRCSPEIVAQAGVEVVVTDEQEGGQDEDLERFKEFLDQVTPEDFETGKEPGAG